MYPVSNDYIEAFKKSDIVTEVIGTITLKSGSIISISDDDIAIGSLTYREQCISGNNLDIGSVYAAELNITLTVPFDNPYKLNDAIISIRHGFETISGVEYVPLGIFNVHEPLRQIDGVNIQAFDNMILLDKDTVGLPASGTPYQLVAALSSKCGVTLSTTLAQFSIFANSDVTLTIPDNSKVKTCRDLLMWVCQITCTFARFDRLGGLELVSVSGRVPVRSISADDRYSSPIVSDYTIKITKLEMTAGETLYSTGTDGMTMTLEENPLLVDTDIDAVLADILATITTCEYTPCEIDYIGDPALQPGDFVTVTDLQGEDVISYITHSSWAYRNSHKLQSRGQAGLIKGRYSQTGKVIASVQVDVKKAAESAQQAQQTADNAMQSADGKNAVFHQAEAPSIVGRKVGDTWFDSGNDNTIYTFDGAGWAPAQLGENAIKDLSITNAKIGNLDAGKITAGEMSANRVRTGILQNDDESVYIDLDKGEAKFNKVDIKVGKAETLDAIAKDLRKLVEPGPFSGFSLTSEFIDVIARDINIYGLVTFRALDKSLQNQVKAFEKNGSLLDALTMIEADATVINGGLIATNTILGKSIVAGEITTDHLAAKSITIAKLEQDAQDKIENGDSAKSILDENTNKWDNAAVNAFAAALAIDTNSEKWNLGASAKSLLDTLTMLQEDVTVINGGKIATNSIAANAIAITDLRDFGKKISGWTLDAEAIVGLYSSFSTILRIPKNSDTVVFQSGTIADPAVKINAMGQLFATMADIKGSVKATAFEVLNGSGVKIGGLYGSGTSAYLAAGKIINPANINGTSITVGKRLNEVTDSVLFKHDEQEFLSFISFGSGGTEHSLIRGHGTYLEISNGEYTVSPSITLDLKTLVGERRLTLDGKVIITEGMEIGGNVVPKTQSQNFGAVNSRWLYGYFGTLNTSILMYNNKTVYQDANGHLYVSV